MLSSRKRRSDGDLPDCGLRRRRPSLSLRTRGTARTPHNSPSGAPPSIPTLGVETFVARSGRNVQRARDAAVALVLAAANRSVVGQCASPLSPAMRSSSFRLISRSQTIARLPRPQLLVCEMQQHGSAVLGTRMAAACAMSFSIEGSTAEEATVRPRACATWSKDHARWLSLVPCLVCLPTSPRT